MKSMKTTISNFFKNFVLPIAVGVIVAFVFKVSCNPVRINGPSMNPTLSNGEFYYSSCNFTKDDITYGTIVVLDPINDDRDYVKRIVAMPGDTVEIEDGDLYVNDELSPYQFEKIENGGIVQNNRITLDEDEYFCMGDNRNNSLDSRMIGPIKYSQLQNILLNKIPITLFIAFGFSIVIVIFIITTILDNKKNKQ